MIQENIKKELEKKIKEDFKIVDFKIPALDWSGYNVSTCSVEKWICDTGGTPNGSILGSAWQSPKYTIFSIIEQDFIQRGNEYEPFDRFVFVILENDVESPLISEYIEGDEGRFIYEDFPSKRLLYIETEENEEDE